MEEKKPHMKFLAKMIGLEAHIYPACPHSEAWFQSMGKRTIKPEELHWVGDMGIELSMVKGEIKQVQKILGRDKIDRKGVLTGKFDMARQV